MVSRLFHTKSVFPALARHVAVAQGRTENSVYGEWCLWRTENGLYILCCEDDVACFFAKTVPVIGDVARVVARVVSAVSPYHFIKGQTHHSIKGQTPMFLSLYGKEIARRRVGIA